MICNGQVKEGTTDTGLELFYNSGLDSLHSTHSLLLGESTPWVKLVKVRREILLSHSLWKWRAAAAAGTAGSHKVNVVDK